MVWDGLLYRDPKTNEYLPNLATAYKWVDSKTLQFDLRKGVKFHNGEKFDADDVVFTLNYLGDPANGAKPARNVNWWNNAEKLGEYKVQLNLKKEFPAPIEWGAASIEPRGVMIEELLTDENRLPNDWKVHVFHGKAGFIQYDTGRMTSHSQSIYTLEGQRIHQTNCRWSEEHTPDEIVSILGKDGIDELVRIAERLAEDIDYTRVDMFLADGKWYFGEFTNYHNSCHPQSIEWEELAGGLWLNHEG